MKSLKDFFGSLFGKSTESSLAAEQKIFTPAAESLREMGVGQAPSAPYKKGDLIGQKYEVYGVLGKGGFGVVYLVYSHEAKSVYALKTFKDEYLEDAETRDRFRKEAQVWVDLERHPYLVRAYFVEQISGRLYIGMEYITPDEQGLNSLEAYLKRRPPDLAQTLRWAIQFSYGMEYAYTKGMRCHRDIKPGNIMISQDKTVKISDFGLAGVFGACKRISSVRLSFADGQVGLSGRTMEGTGFGTPTHMPPEQFTKAASCDERSDIYSFGITLYQMATGGRIPFLAPLPRDNSGEEMARFWMDMKTLHSESPLPQLSTPLFHIIQRCLEKSPDKRYKRFLELRSELEPLLRQETGEVIKPQEIAELGGREWSNKGISLDSLGRYEEAIQCYDKAIELDPRWAGAWIGKANSLNNLGRYEEAIHWCDKAIEVEPRYTFAWNNKGNALNSLGRYEEAIQCYDKAIELDPQLAMAWNNKGSSLDSLGRHGEAIRCYEKALEFDPRNAAAWTNKGDSLQSLGRYEEAILCCDKALEYDPRLAAAWFNKAFSEDKLGRGQDAARSYRQFLALVPPKYAKEIEHARQRLRELEG